MGATAQPESIPPSRRHSRRGPAATGAPPASCHENPVESRPGPWHATDVLATDRLRLRRFTDDDASFAFGLHANPDLARFVPTAIQSSLDDARAWIARIRESEAPLRGWWLVERHDGTPVAAVILKAIPPSGGGEPVDVEIGWRQHPDHTGNGYVTEAARSLLAAALDSGLPRVIAVTHPDNHASQRVCGRLRMRPLGRTAAYYDQTLELFEARPGD